MEAELLSAVSTVGFPVVAFGLMYRMANDALQKNTAALVEIKLTLERVCAKLDNTHTG